MFITGHVLSAAAAAVALIIVIEMLRRGHLRERHILWWLCAGILGLAVTLFPGLLDRISSFFGIANPLNLAFFAAIVVLFLVSLQQAKELTKSEERIRTLAEQVTLLDERLRRVETGDAISDTE